MKPTQAFQLNVIGRTSTLGQRYVVCARGIYRYAFRAEVLEQDVAPEFMVKVEGDEAWLYRQSVTEDRVIACVALDAGLTWINNFKDHRRVSAALTQLQASRIFDRILGPGLAVRLEGRTIIRTRWDGHDEQIDAQIQTQGALEDQLQALKGIIPLAHSQALQEIGREILLARRGAGKPLAYNYDFADPQEQEQVLGYIRSFCPNLSERVLQDSWEAVFDGYLRQWRSLGYRPHTTVLGTEGLVHTARLYCWADIRDAKLTPEAVARCQSWAEEEAKKLSDTVVELPET